MGYLVHNYPKISEQSISIAIIDIERDKHLRVRKIVFREISHLSDNAFERLSLNGAVAIATLHGKQCTNLDVGSKFYDQLKTCPCVKKCSEDNDLFQGIFENFRLNRSKTKTHQNYHFVVERPSSCIIL